MSLGSEETRSGLLKAVGAVPRAFEEEREEEVVEQRDEESTASEEEVVETKKEEKEFSSLEDYTEKVFEDLKPKEEQSELDRLRQQNADLEKRLLESTKQAESEIASEQEEEDFENIDWTAPEMVKLFANELDLDEEEAEKFAKLSGNLAEVVTRGTVGKKLEVLEKRQAHEEAVKRQDTAKQQAWDNLQYGLNDAKQKGDLEAQVVDQFMNEGENSLFALELHRNPSILSSRDLVRRTVLAIAREVQLGADINPTNTTGSVGVTEEATGTTTVANTEDVRETKNEKSPEELIREEIMSAGIGARGKLPGIFGR